MFKATNTTSTTLAANATIPFIVKKNTFPYVTANNNTITFNKAGNFNIKATLNITATGTSANLGLYNNGTLIPESNVTIDTTSGDEYQLAIDDLETIINTIPYSERVNITLRTTTGFTADIVNLGIVELR